MNCDYCHLPMPVDHEGVSKGFIIERQGRRSLCPDCSQAIVEAVVHRFCQELLKPRP